MRTLLRVAGIGAWAGLAVAMGMGGWNFKQVGMAAYSEELLKKWPLPFYISPSGTDIGRPGHTLCSWAERVRSWGGWSRRWWR